MTYKIMQYAYWTCGRTYVEKTLAKDGFFYVATNNAIEADSVADAKYAFYSRANPGQNTKHVFIRGPRGGHYPINRK